MTSDDLKKEGDHPYELFQSDKHNFLNVVSSISSDK